ncbi:MAG: protocatechuate 3,4-dioxygenase [Pseudomonadota bacterium]
MARLVAAFGSSHSIMLTAGLENWISDFRTRDPKLPLYDRAGNRCSYDDCVAEAAANADALIAPAAITRRFEQAQAAMDALQAAITAARLDALVVVGDDQDELFHDAHMPAIAIYYGATIRNAAQPYVSATEPLPDWYQRAQQARLEPDGDAHHPVHSALASHLIDGLVQRDFDIAAVKAIGPEQYEGHAYSFVHRRYLAGSALPIVPVFLNTYTPPNQPSPRRCVALGRALAAEIARFPGDIRVGAIASGGLSHFRVEEDLDRAIIDAMRAKDLDALAGLDPRRAAGRQLRDPQLAGGGGRGDRPRPRLGRLHPRLSHAGPDRHRPLLRGLVVSAVPRRGRRQDAWPSAAAVRQLAKGWRAR